LNPAAFRALGEPDAVVLLFDDGSRAIGLKPTSADVPHAYPVRRQRSGNYLVTVEAFCTHHSIDRSRTKTFEPAVENGILLLELDKAADVPLRQRQNRQAETKHAS